MNEAKHTPGPWSRNFIYGALRHISKNVDFDAFWSPSPEEEAALDAETLHFPDVRSNPDDADLIAAAPELLAALGRLEGQATMTSDYDDSKHSTLRSAVKQARAAIAKATGQQYAILGGSPAPASTEDAIGEAVKQQTL